MIDIINEHSLNLLILNIDKDFSSFYDNIYDLVFKHNYSVNILDISNDVYNISNITKTIFKINPTILCIRVFNYNMLQCIKNIVNELNLMYIDSLIVLCDISPDNIMIKNIGGINCDFYCSTNVDNTILNMLKFFGNKDVGSSLENVWYKDIHGYTLVK